MPPCQLSLELARNVRIADDGREAIELFSQELQRGSTFDEVVTDFGMPEVHGTQVACQVKALRPSTLVVMLTGWGRRMAEDGELPAFVDSLLSKPPRLEELRATLRPPGPAVHE